MRKRFPLKRGTSKRIFRKTAGAYSVHPRNLFGAPMRGGVRL